MTPVLSIVIVSFNTCDLLRRCLCNLLSQLDQIPAEIFVVDNASRDGSVEMVASEFPGVRLYPNTVNLGFAAANNIALRQATGRYAVLLNSDAFPEPDALRRALEQMDADPTIGLGGARLVGAEGAWQPSARMFPSLLNDFLILSGLSARFPRSHLFGRADRTWADQSDSADVDWVPAAFSIIRHSMFEKVGYLDEKFFFYYEEVDFCMRLKRAGHRVRYFADVVVVHLGGESSRKITAQPLSRSGAQLSAWRMRAAFLYYRKHHGSLVWGARELERFWYLATAIKNRARRLCGLAVRPDETAQTIQLLDQAWRETCGGLVSPERPW